MTLERPKHSGLRHVALNVLDVALVEEFYVDFLGFEVEWRPDENNVYLCSGVDNLALHKVDVVDAAGQQSLAHIGVIVDQIDHVDQWYEYLYKNQVKMASQPKTHRDGARSFYCLDPENIVIQIIYHPPLSTK